MASHNLHRCDKVFVQMVNKLNEPTKQGSHEVEERDQEGRVTMRGGGGGEGKGQQIDKQADGCRGRRTKK